MPLDECSAAMGFQVKEIKRQSRAVKVTHPPADRRQLHKRSSFTSAMKRQRNETASSAVALRAMAGQASKASWT